MKATEITEDKPSNPPLGLGLSEGLGAASEAERVAHWLCGSVPFHSCGNCTRGFHSGPVGIRMLCWEGHHAPTFLMPTDGVACNDFKPANAEVSGRRRKFS
jgi:hypothetical protein